ncbi:MAG: hypothetical protein ACREPQ_11650 [Rhodanobacter sp.]
MTKSFRGDTYKPQGTADARGVPLFIKARTDLFLGAAVKPPEGMTEAKERAAAYARGALPDSSSPVWSTCLPFGHCVTA